MEELLQKLDANEVWFKALYIWNFISAYVYALATSVSLVLFKASTRKADEEGNAATKFSIGYLVTDMKTYFISSFILLFVTVTLASLYFKKTEPILLGALVGMASSYLGLFWDLAGKAIFNRGQKELKKLDQ